MQTPSHFAPSGPQRRFVVAMLAAAFGLFAGGAAAQAANSARAASEPFAAGRILVMPRAGLPDAAMARLLREHGGGVGRRVGRSNLHVVDLPAGQEQAAVERLARHPHVKFAELDRWVAPNLAVNDPYLGSQWHLPKIGAATAWDAATGAGITIAILDTGVDGAHPDLAGRMVAGWNIADNNANTADVYGHGTKVAGAAAASLNNGLGVSGVAGGARIMPIRISGTDGRASLSAMAQGLTWAADHGARVANISYLSADSAAVNSAASYMKSKGGLVLTSAGNYGTDEGIAATTSMIPVSATDGSDNKTSWSSYGSYVALSAPGQGIYTTVNGGAYGSVSGTSFSSPISAGVVALMMSANPSLSSSAIERLLYSSAVDLGTPGRDSLYGYGRVDAAAAVQAALGEEGSRADLTPPSAAIVAPLGSSAVSGLVGVNVAASDNVGVSRVELRANGALVATDTASPYAFVWDSGRSPNGAATLVATAYDAAGNVGQSASVIVNVSNTTAVDTEAPTVRISNPSDGSAVRNKVSIRVAATDDSGATGIRQSLTINGKVVATAVGGSLSYNWNLRKESRGTYVIQAVAEDAAGNRAAHSVRVVY